MSGSRSRYLNKFSHKNYSIRYFLNFKNNNKILKNYLNLKNDKFNNYKYYSDNSVLGPDSNKHFIIHPHYAEKFKNGLDKHFEVQTESKLSYIEKNINYIKLLYFYSFEKKLKSKYKKLNIKYLDNKTIKNIVKYRKRLELVRKLKYEVN
jgi:hypothetical protein